jgi:hypothetical protein
VFHFQLNTNSENTAPFLDSVDGAALKGHVIPIGDNKEFILSKMEVNPFAYPVTHDDAKQKLNCLQGSFLFFVYFIICIPSAMWKATALELDAKKDLGIREQEEQASLVQMAGVLTNEHNQKRKKLLNDIDELQFERDDIIAKKEANLAKEITKHEDLKRVCIVNKDPTSDELNLICSQQGFAFFFDINFSLKTL